MAIKLQIFVFVISVFLFTFFSPLIHQSKAQAAGNLNTMSDTLTNPRLSFKGIVNGTIPGTSNMISIIGGTATAPDKDLRHLFSGDVICFPGPLQNGCINQALYTVSSVDIGNTRFTFSPSLVNLALKNDYAISTQSARHTISFKPATALSGTSNVIIKLPLTQITGKSGPSYASDGIPDHDGFDSNGITTTNIGTNLTINGPVGVVLQTAGTTYTTSTQYHIITINIGGSVPITSALSVTVGGTGNQMFVNPAPGLTHIRGKVPVSTSDLTDLYSVSLETQTSGAVTLDTGSVYVAPIEGVFLSATVNQSLSFKICGITNGNTHVLNTSADSSCTTFAGGAASVPINACNIGSTNFDFSTDAVSVPFGTMNSATFKTGAQYVEVQTNAVNGFSVKVGEYDQMGFSGNVCAGTAPSSGNWTFPNTKYGIRDTLCGSSPCSETTAAAWNDATNYPGLGYTLNTVNSGTAVFVSVGTGNTFSLAKQFADQDRADVPVETPQNIMYETIPTDASGVVVCYRMSIPGSQPAGYYYNVVKYTATPVF